MKGACNTTQGKNKNMLLCMRMSDVSIGVTNEER